MTSKVIFEPPQKRYLLTRWRHQVLNFLHLVQYFNLAGTQASHRTGQTDIQSERRNVKESKILI